MDQGARDNSGAQDVMEGSNGSTHEADSKENARLVGIPSFPPSA
jgi:hypothetical protein